MYQNQQALLIRRKGYGAQGPVYNKRYIKKSEQQYVVYVLYPFSLREERKLPLKAFFKRDFNDIDQKISGIPVFFKLANAIHYARCLGSRYLVLRTVVDQSKIVGMGSGQSQLKANSIAKPNIYAAVPAWEPIENNVYNSYFS